MSLTIPFEIINDSEQKNKSAETLAAYYGKGIVFRRWAATLIDFILLGSLFFFTYGIIEILGNELYYETSFIWNILLLAIIISYYFIQEAMSGYTIGKFILGIKVVDNNCEIPGFKKSLIRTLFRLIEVNPFIFGGIPAGIAVLSNKKKQRIGDVVANTYVIKCKDISKGNNSQNKKRISLLIGLITILAATVGIVGICSLIM